MSKRKNLLKNLQIIKCKKCGTRKPRIIFNNHSCMRIICKPCRVNNDFGEDVNCYCLELKKRVNEYVINNSTNL